MAGRSNLLKLRTLVNIGCYYCSAVVYFAAVNLQPKVNNCLIEHAMCRANDTFCWISSMAVELGEACKKGLFCDFIAIGEN